MGVCWYCHWGWPEQVRAIYDEGCEKAGWLAMHYGHAHIVWEDENWDCVQWCLDDAADWKEKWNDGRFTDEQLTAVTKSLQKLLTLPKEVRECEPKDYDDEHPENFPPPEHLKVERHTWHG